MTLEEFQNKKLDEELGVSIFDFVSMMYEVKHEDQKYYSGTWLNFKRLENVPENKFFNLSNNGKNIEMINIDKEKIYTHEIEVDALEILEYTLGDRSFSLNPVRWTRVRKDLSEGKCYMPEIAYDKDTKKLKILDGRHRIVALTKFYNFKKIKCFMMKEDFDKYLNECEVRFE